MFDWIKKCWLVQLYHRITLPHRVRASVNDEDAPLLVVALERKGCEDHVFELLLLDTHPPRHLGQTELLGLLIEDRAPSVGLDTRNMYNYYVMGVRKLYIPRRCT